VTESAASGETKEAHDTLKPLAIQAKFKLAQHRGKMTQSDEDFCEAVCSIMGALVRALFGDKEAKLWYNVIQFRTSKTMKDDDAKIQPPVRETPVKPATDDVNDHEAHFKMPFIEGNEYEESLANVSFGGSPLFIPSPNG